MEEKISFNSCGKRLIGLKGVPEETSAPGVILFHGLSNTKTDCPLINETTAALIKHKFFTLRFDFFGSGESLGMLRDKTWEELRQNAIDATEFLADDDRVTNIGIWGRSLGGTFAILCGAHPRIKALVLATPDVYVTKTFSKENFHRLKKKQEELEKQGKVLPGTGKYKGPLQLNEAFFSYLPKIEAEVLQMLPKLKNVLVLATTPDIKVPLENSIAIINQVREPKKIIVFEGVDHGYTGVEDKAVGEVIEWFTRHLRSK